MYLNYEQGSAINSKNWGRLFDGANPLMFMNGQEAHASNGQN